MSFFSYKLDNSPLYVYATIFFIRLSINGHLVGFYISAVVMMLQ